jgi:hypothetical protein
LEKHFLNNHNKNVVVQLRLRFGGINNLWIFRRWLFGIFKRFFNKNLRK